MRKKLLSFCAMLLCILSSYAQTTVTGKVTDDKGAGIAGATILEKGTRNGTSAGSDGAFSLKIKSGATLVISALGFETKEVKASASVTVQLTTDVKALSEVVVTGVGVATSKKKLPISVETINGEKLNSATTGTQNLAQALVGKVAGAQITSKEGTPGAPLNILLRGVNSLRGGTGPMILVDGLEVRATDLGALDLNNVERVEVVEGAASSTIYGAQGANGVIQIFTKKGKAGQTNIDFSSSYGISNFLNVGNLHQATTHGFKTDANNNVVDANGVILGIKPDGTLTAGVNSAGVTQGGLVWLSTNPSTDGSKPYNQNLKYYDHLDQLFGPAARTSSSLSISGGAQKNDFALTLSHSEEESVIKDNGVLKRTNLTANIGTELFKGFKIRSITQLVYQNNNFNPYFTAGVSGTFFRALNTSPFFDFNWKDANGDYAYALNASPVSVNGYNPNYYKEYSFGSDETIDVIQNIQASYKVNRFLDLEAKYGINYEKEQVNQVYKNQTQNINIISRSVSGIGGFNGKEGSIFNYLYNTTFQNALTTATLHFDLQKDLHLKLPVAWSTQVGYDYRKNVFKQYNTSGDGLQLYPIYNMNQTATQVINSDFVRPFVTFGTYLSQSLDYGNIAGIQGGFRSDFSSAFGQGSTAQTFYTGKGYIRLSQFNFWNSLSKVISEFKIRGSYGEAGIQPGAFDRYVTLNTRTIGTNLAFTTPTVQNNPKLNVEVSKETELGADISFNLGKGKFFTNATLSGTVWKRTSNDVIYQVDAPPSSGGAGYLTNSFTLSSKGVTFILNLNVVRTKDFNWDFTANFNQQNSQIDAISTGQPIIVTSGAGYGNYVLQAGSRIGQLYGLKTFRDVNQTKQDGTLYIDKANAGKYQVVNGTLVDTATKGIMFTNENYAYGDPNPKFNMAFINNVTYKGFTLGFQFDWVYGSHLYNQMKEWMYRDGIHGDYETKLTINGQTGAWANYYTSAYADMWGSINGARNSIKDYYFEDASFLRLRSVSLGVDVLRYVKIKYFKKLQFVITGRNLVTFTHYTGMDPETSSGNTNSGFDRGVDYATTPNNKTYQVGLNIGF